ncbi:MAG: fibronectin type III domain-containing protein [Candidatus Yonathbacteria bacterium]|nr:fibronectin type III domain-containing protein [Candidatus Yonathbacteria bacterium]
MKKFLMVILCASIVMPSFALANENSERKGENGARHAALAVEAAHFEKREKKEEKKEEKREIKKQKTKKINYFFCVTRTGWNVVPAEALKDNNGANFLGEDCVKLPGNIAKRLQAIMGSTGTTTATTTVDIVAPIISNTVVSSIASTTAMVSWNTNELATGKLYYGTSTPLTLSMGTTTLSYTHSFNLVGLTASTTYQFMVESKDGVNNTATSTASLTTTI